LTVRIDDELDAWIKATAKKRGISEGKLVRDQLELGRAAVQRQAFMKFVGAFSGPRNLSTRKGFSKK